MTHQELIDISNLMRELGVTYVRTQEYAIKLRKDMKPRKYSPPDVITSVPKTDVEVKQDQSAEIPHVVQELTSVMKLSDAELIDRLFPTEEKEGDHELHG